MFATAAVMAILLGPVSIAGQDRDHLPAPRVLPLLQSDDVTTFGTRLPRATGGAIRVTASAEAGDSFARPLDIPGFEALDVSHLSASYRSDMLVAAPRRAPARLGRLPDTFPEWGLAGEEGDSASRVLDAVRAALEDRTRRPPRPRTALGAVAVLRIDSMGERPDFLVRGGAAGVIWAALDR